MSRRGPSPVLRLKLEQLFTQDPSPPTSNLAELLDASPDSIRSLKSRIKRDGFRNRFCPECGKGAVIFHEGERFCAACGFLEASRPEYSRGRVEASDATDPQSYDNGLGSEPLGTIRDLRFNSKMLRNSWQVVLGNYEKGLHDRFIEGCLKDLFRALDGATD